jgi:hypothetical protein
LLLTARSRRAISSLICEEASWEAAGRVEIPNARSPKRSVRHNGEFVLIEVSFAMGGSISKESGEQDRE